MIVIPGRSAQLALLLGVFCGFPILSLAASEQSNASLNLGYRVDSLDWNIHGGSTGPDILSELEWRDMDILQLRGELSGANAAGIYFRGSAAYGWVLDGVNQDSDYAGDNRTLEFSRSLNDVNGSRVLDISGGLGAAFFVGDRDQYRIIPMAGYSYHNQHFRMRNGNQVISDSAYFDLYNPDPTKDVHPVGPIFGLNSSYDANWHGPWLGVDVLLDLQEGGTAFVRLEGHAVKYYAKANWNLRDDFAHPVSFEHEADGQGWVLELGWRNPLSRYYWTWGATVSLQSWTTDPGTDRIYLANNNYFEGRLNEANWSSRSLNITLSKNFSD